MVCSFLLCSKANQLYLHVYPLFFGFPYHLGHHRALSRVPCAESNKDFFFPRGNEALSKWNMSRVPCSNFVLIMFIGYSSWHKVTHVMLHGLILLDHPPLSFCTDDGSTQPVGTASSLAAMWAFTQPDSAQFPLPRIIHFASLPPGKICIQFSRLLTENPQVLPDCARWKGPQRWVTPGLPSQS